MGKIKITTLTDKIKDDEILSKLKSIGVKIKDKEKEKEEQTLSEAKEKSTASGETVIEKRVASTVIRRRVQAPPAETKPTMVTQPPEAAAAGQAAETKKEEPPKRTEEPVIELVKVQKETKEAVAADKEPSVKSVQIERVEIEPVAEQVEEAPKAGEVEGAGPIEKTEIEKKEEREAAQIAEETAKADVDGIGEEKKQEITRALEEAYKQDLDKELVLVEDEETEEERKKKKAERLAKRAEEEELEEAKLKGKGGVFKRKVVIKEEDLYAARRQRGKTLPFRKDRRDRRELSVEEEKKLEAKPTKKVIRVGDDIQVSELAKRLSVKASDVITRLLRLGIISNVNQTIDHDTAYLIASDFGYEVEKIVSVEEEFMTREGEQTESPEDLKPRSPVVTIMGHVDHGKTLLLDTIRNTNVAEREAGGITQHIGAYVAKVDKKEITFVDTPGHEAFTAMRARGALVTDIVILVVAADDGVMPQTREAIDHAKAANVPIIVAVNKIDKQNANPDKVMKELSELGLQPEEWGGTTLTAKISAKKKVGIQELLELILLQAELLELKANPDKLAKGIIIESGLDKGHGPFGTVIIQEGTLKIQDPFVAGATFGRVRALIDDKGKRIQKAPPATPVMVVGFSDVPQAGDMFIATTEERYAREVSRFRQDKIREQEQAKSSRITLDELYSRMGETAKLTLNVILKGDARGTLDAISDALKRLSTEAVEINVIHNGVGAITETDVNLAMASGAIIIGFNVKPMAKTQSLADQEKVDIRTYSVIYDMIDDVRKAMEGLLAPRIVEVKIGTAEVRKTFTVSRIGTIAGCYVTEGKVTRAATAKVIRKGDILFSGKIASLKRFKDDIKEVTAGYECGISFENFNDIQEGDTMEFYVEEEEKQTL
ncbi:MAG: Translation initiation factor IF-2 [Syntrophorhabdaceae bacterium PtaU1.Bin034]|nr:MAG: Translation initiation factor IF-2 [Syntrophorhabdaceae bacterium PtaU1.Bin034]